MSAFAVPTTEQLLSLSDDDLAALQRLVRRERQRRRATLAERNLGIIAAVAAGDSFDAAAARLGLTKGKVAGVIFRAGGTALLRAGAA